MHPKDTPNKGKIEGEKNSKITQHAKQQLWDAWVQRLGVGKPSCCAPLNETHPIGGTFIRVHPKYLALVVMVFRSVREVGSG